METQLLIVECDHQTSAQHRENENGEDQVAELGKEVLFSSKEHQASFERLSPRQKQYMSAYVRTGSPSEVAKEMGLTGSVKGVSKRLTQISKLMGFDGVKDIKTKRKPKKSATAASLMELLKSQKFRCALSGKKLNPDNSQLDHIEPLANNGTNDVCNLQWLEDRVNKAKGTMRQAEFIEMCVSVAVNSGGCTPPAPDQSNFTGF